MKTSNKLLIALAALFFIVPLSAMIYDSRNYIDAKDYKAEDNTPKKFEEALKGHTNQALGTFSAINIVDGKSMHFGITFIKDAKFGVKVNDRYKGILIFNVNANGILEIAVNKIPEGNNYVNLLVYAPSLVKVTVANAGGLNLPGTFDSLEVNVKNLSNFHLGDDNTINKLTVNADHVEDLSFWEANINNLTISLNNTSFKSSETNYKSLVINSTGKGDIDLESQNEKKPTSIDNLSITTGGKGDINLKNVIAKNVSGSLSDSTTVNMPVVYLRQLFKH